MFAGFVSAYSGGAAPDSHRTSAGSQAANDDDAPGGPEAEASLLGGVVPVKNTVPDELMISLVITGQQHQIGFTIYVRIADLDQ